MRECVRVCVCVHTGIQRSIRLNAGGCVEHERSVLHTWHAGHKGVCACLCTSAWIYICTRAHVYVHADVHIHCLDGSGYPKACGAAWDSNPKPNAGILKS